MAFYFLSNKIRIKILYSMFLLSIKFRHKLAGFPRIVLILNRQSLRVSSLLTTMS